MVEQKDMFSEQELAEMMNYELMNTLLPQVMLISLETVLGFFGNLLVLYVYIFRYRQRKFRYFVLCLSLTDTISCLTSMPMELVTLTHWYVYPGQGLCKAKCFFVVFTACSECFCLFGIAIDRYRKVCEPLGWQITLATAKRICCFIYLLALLFASPFIYFWGTTTYLHPDEERNITVTTCGRDLSNEHGATYAIAIEAIMFGTLVTMTVLYTLIARRLLVKRKPTNVGHAMMLNHSEKKLVYTSTAISGGRVDDSEFEIYEYHTSGLKKKATTVTHRKCSQQVVDKSLDLDRYGKYKVDVRIRRMSIIMLILTLSFIVTASVYLGLLFFLAISDENMLDDMSNSHKAIMFFFMRLYFINHVINPIVYISMDPHFRKTIRKKLFRIFSCKCCCNIY